MPVGLKLGNCNPLIPLPPRLDGMLLRRCPGAVPLSSMLPVITNANCLLRRLGSAAMLHGWD